MSRKPPSGPRWWRVLIAGIEAVAISLGTALFILVIGVPLILTGLGIIDIARWILRALG